MTLDFHPTKSNLLLVGSMDRTTYIVDTECTDVPVMESFNDHTRLIIVGGVSSELISGWSK